MVLAGGNGSTSTLGLQPICGVERMKERRAFESGDACFSSLHSTLQEWVARERDDAVSLADGGVKRFCAWWKR
jgi:hypothetical protein